jgi:molybdate transport system substrate-binding protein
VSATNDSTIAGQYAIDVSQPRLPINRAAPLNATQFSGLIPRKLTNKRSIWGNVMTKTVGRIVAAAALLLVQAGFSSAADIKVFSTIGVQSALEELAPKFEKASGHKLNITWGTAAILVKRVQAGETADLMVLTKQSLDALTKDNNATAGTDATFASSGMAVVVKKGAPKPDISTPDSFKQALLNAKAIAYSDPAAGGASGVYFAKLLERMGIADQMKAKTKHPPPSGNSAVLVVNGEAELAIQQEPEVMSIAGVDMVGSLPGDLNNITIYSAGVGKDSKQAEGANALIKFLHTPEAAAVFKAKGLTPVAAPKAS